MPEERTNHDRAQSARLALDSFTTENYAGTPFAELIGDLFHLADELGMSRKALLRTARDFYEQNIEDETFSLTLSLARVEPVSYVERTQKPIDYVERVRKRQAEQQERGV